MLPKPGALVPPAVKLITPDVRVKQYLPNGISVCLAFPCSLFLAPKRAEGRMPRVDETYRSDGLLISSNDFIEETVGKLFADKKDPKAVNIFVNIENVEEKSAEMKRLETEIDQMERKSLQLKNFKQIFSQLLAKNI